MKYELVELPLEVKVKIAGSASKVGDEAVVSCAWLVDEIGSEEVPLASSAPSVVSSEDVGPIRAPALLFELSASSVSAPGLLRYCQHDVEYKSSILCSYIS